MLCLLGWGTFVSHSLVPLCCSTMLFHSLVPLSIMSATLLFKYLTVLTSQPAAHMVHELHCRTRYPSTPAIVHSTVRDASPERLYASTQPVPDSLPASIHVIYHRLILASAFAQHCSPVTGAGNVEMQPATQLAHNSAGRALLSCSCIRVPHAH